VTVSALGKMRKSNCDASEQCAGRFPPQCWHLLDQLAESEAATAQICARNKVMPVIMGGVSCLTCRCAAGVPQSTHNGSLVQKLLSHPDSAQVEAFLTPP
jgi:hypothetical protein